MKTEKKLGIWMDHAHAHLMEYGGTIVTKTVTSDSTHEEKEKTLQKGESMMFNKEQQQEAQYYKVLGESIKDYDAVIFTSQSAATYGAKFCQEDLLANKNMPILAIGLATQKTLQKFNLSSSIPPTFRQPPSSDDPSSISTSQ